MKKIIIPAICAVLLFIILQYFSVAKILFSPDEELWDVCSEAVDGEYSSLKVSVLLTRGADVGFSIGGVTSFELAVLSKKEDLVKRMLPEASDEVKEKALRTIKQEIKDDDYTKRLEEILKSK